MSRLSDLEAERNFLLDSITDLDREHAAGDLDDADYQGLRADYVRRAARALREIETISNAPVSSAASGSNAPFVQRVRRVLGRRRVRVGLGVGAALSLLFAAGLLAAHLAGVRLPGQSATGSITMSQAALVAEDLSKAAIEANSGNISSAILLFQQVLAQVPDQQVALTYDGWLTRLSGLSAHDEAAIKAGDAQLKSAARLHPDYADGQGLYGVALLQDLHDAKAAVVSFERCRKDGPTVSLLRGISAIAASAYEQAGRGVPATYKSA